MVTCSKLRTIKVLRHVGNLIRALYPHDGVIPGPNLIDITFDQTEFDRYDWTETGVDASLHDGVNLGGHHLGYIWGTMGVWLLVLVRVRLLAAAHCSVRW